MTLADSKNKKETRPTKIVERRTKGAFEPGRTFGQGKVGDRRKNGAGHLRDNPR
jgi:hypothetical protein